MKFSFTPLALAATLLLTSCQKAPEAAITLHEDDGKMVFQNAAGQDLLAYQFATYPAPEGKNPAYKRSAFIHPLNAPGGQRLTQIQPEDHYHHYGIWNPWTHTSFRGREIDFWNLAKEHGTVRFADFKSQSTSEHGAEFTALQEHVVFNEDGTETVALNELVTIAISESDIPNAYIADLTFAYECATDDPFTVLEYRYAGLGWRATEEWNGENSEVLTSEGIPREGSDGSLARWVIAQGAVSGDYAGVLLMSHPSNYNHPEPLRIWPKGNHGGQLFVNFAPTKTTDWEFLPGNTYTLKYRMLVYNNKLDATTAEAAWQVFAK